MSFFLYDVKHSPRKVVIALKIMIIIELILQGLTFFDYLIRLFAVESENVKLDYEICKLKHLRKKTSLEMKKGRFILFIVLPILYRCFFNFQTLYYIISLGSLALNASLSAFLVSRSANIVCSSSFPALNASRRATSSKQAAQASSSFPHI